MSTLLSNLTSTQKYLVVAILAIVLYLFSATVSYSIFSSSTPNFLASDNKATVPKEPGMEEEPEGPKTEECPINGGMHTKMAKERWDKRRPLAVMIENHAESRPQSGLTSASVVYEAVAEGGITRFMAVYLCNYGDVQVGPVRSARTYFLDWLSEYNALYAHVGGANTPGPANALKQIIDYDILDLNQFSIGFPTFWRDYQRLGHPVATEHTMYSTTQKLWDTAAKRQWTYLDANGKNWDATFIKWSFKDGVAGTAAQKITVPFWANQTDYTVTWNYDPTCNCYKRSHGVTEHTDLNNKKVISPKNVVVQFMTESRANDGYEGNAHLLYGTKGQGKALIFQEGKVIEGKWTKISRVAREKFLDEKGQEVKFIRGQIWIQTVPEGSQVVY